MNKFFLHLDNKSQLWEDRLTPYIGYVINNKCKSTTIRSYICAIKTVLKAEGIKITEDTYALGSLIKACRYKNDTIQIRLPIHKYMVNMLIEESFKHFLGIDQSYLATLYATIFSTVYYGLFRIGEIVAGTHPILATDVQIGINKKKIMIILRTSKTHWKNKKPQIIHITSATKAKNKNHGRTSLSMTYCPFELLQQFVAIRNSCKHPAEPFFVFKDNSPISPQQLLSVLNILLHNLSYNSKAYSFHGFHVGRAMNLLEMGVLVETIKKLGRWKSNAVYTYLC